MTQYELLQKKRKILLDASRKAHNRGDDKMRDMWYQKALELNRKASRLSTEEAGKEAPKENTYFFDILPDAVVPITGIRDLIAYLRNTITVWNGMPVIGFRTKKDEVQIKVLASGRPKWGFFGYIRDIGLNIQRGLYR